jgi:hypothetical protein
LTRVCGKIGKELDVLVGVRSSCAEALAGRSASTRRERRAKRLFVAITGLL